MFWIIGSWGLAFSGTPVLAAAVGLGSLGLLAVLPHTGVPNRVLLGLGLSTVLAAWAGLTLGGVDPFGRYWGPPDTWGDWDSLLRLLAWFTWPAWPLALWTLWRWRRQLSSPHVALPLWSVLAAVVSSRRGAVLPAEAPAPAAPRTEPAAPVAVAIKPSCCGG